MLSVRKENPDDYWRKDDFANRTFIIGPMSTTTANLPEAQFSSRTDDNSTSFTIAGCIAVDGNLLLEESDPNYITNALLCQRIESLAV